MTGKHCPEETETRVRIRRPLLTAALTATTARTVHIGGGTGPRGRPDQRPDRRDAGAPPGSGSCSRSTRSFPQTFTNPPLTDQRLNRIARINTIMELPDGSGRRAVPDLNGKLYLVEDGVAAASTSTSPRRSRRSSSPAAASGRASGTSPSTRTSSATAVLHDPHRAGGRSPPTCPTAGRPARSSTASSPSGPPPTRPRTCSPAPAARCCGSASAARSTASRRSTSTRPPGAATATTDNLYLAVGDGGLGRAATPTRRTWRCRTASSCGSTRWARTRPTGSTASRPRTRSSARPARSARSTRTACATRTGSAGTGRPAGCTSATSASTPSRRSTRCGPATTSAGASARARSSSTRRRPNPCDRHLPAAGRRRRLHLSRRRVRPQPGPRLELHLGRRRRGGRRLRLPRQGRAGAARQVRLRRPRRRPRALHRGERDAPRPRAGHDPPARRCSTSAGQPVRMQELSGPGAPGDPNRVDLRFGTDAQGELYILAKANGKIWKVDRHPHVRGGRRRRHPGPRHHAADQLGAGHPVEVAVHRRPGHPRRGRRQPARPAPPVRVRGPDGRPGAVLGGDQCRGAAGHAGRDHQPGRDHRLRLPVGHGVLLRPPLDRQHDLPAQRHLQGQQRRPASASTTSGTAARAAPTRRWSTPMARRAGAAPARRPARSRSTWTAPRTR